MPMSRQSFSRSSKVLQGVETAEGLHPGNADAALEDGADHRMDRTGIGLQQAFHRRRALCDPGAAVEQLGGLEQRGGLPLSGLQPAFPL